MVIQKKKLCISLLVTFLCTIAFGANLVQAAPASTVGCVDFTYLLNHHPDTLKANEEFKVAQEQARKEFEAKSAGLSDTEKRELDVQLGQQLAQKRQELLNPITEKIASAIKAVREAKGLSVVVARNVIIDGGVDITEEVLKKLTGK